MKNHLKRRVLSLLISSNLLINLNKSRDYLLLGLFLNLLIIFLILQQNYSLIYTAIFCSMLIFPMINIYKTKKPHPNYLQLNFYQKKWFLHLANGEKIEYEKIKIRFDAGFFMLISLRGKNYHKNLVIFYDQITNDERRRIFLLEKIV